MEEDILNDDFPAPSPQRSSFNILNARHIQQRQEGQIALVFGALPISSGQYSPYDGLPLNGSPEAP
jgi:hypothetical protein